MAENSGIEWTNHTFNPWWGCTKISPACDNCYAERDARRFEPKRVLWGVNAERRTFGEKHWADPLKWEEAARRAQKPARVFCASMADLFDNEAPEGQRERVFDLISRTPNLRWMLLTKRVGNVARMVPWEWMNGFPANVWMGITIFDQGEADRDVRKLVDLPVNTTFVSAEPLGSMIYLPESAKRLTLIIAGGESGSRARPGHVEWYRALRDYALKHGINFFFKQWGEWIHESQLAKIQIPGGNSIPVHKWDDATRSFRIGKTAAGRHLDGEIHDGMPAL